MLLQQKGKTDQYLKIKISLSPSLTNMLQSTNINLSFTVTEEPKLKCSDLHDQTNVTKLTVSLVTTESTKK